MTRIAYICKDRGIPIDGLKGSAIHARSMMRALAECGAEVVVLSPRIGRTDWAASWPIQFINLPENQSSGDPPSPVAALPEQTSIEPILQDCHLRSPFDAVYERLSLSAPGASRWCRRSGVPHWVEVNAPLVKEAATHRQLAEQEQAAFIEREVLTHADLLLPVSPWLERWLRQMGCAGERIHVLPNGVPEEWISTQRSSELETAGKCPLRIGFVGSLRPWHDVEILIKAMALLPEGDFHLTIVGDGPLRDRLGEWMSDEAVRRRVEWLGARPQGDIPALIDRMDVCVAPHPAMDDFYFCPIKIFEYGARRRPVIAADVPELREQFPANALAFYNPGDARGLADAIRAVADDPSRRVERADALFDFVSQHTWRRHAAQVLEWGGLKRTEAPGARPENRP